jgi:hypothetical protein
LNEDLLQKYNEIYSLCFFEHIHGIMELHFFLGASGEGLFPKAPTGTTSTEVRVLH